MNLIVWQFLTLTETTSFFEDISEKVGALLTDPSTYNGLNLFLLGIPDLLDGTFNPEEPWSFQHTMDILGTLSIVFSGAKVLDKLGLDDVGGIDFIPNKPKNTSGNLLGMAIPDMDDALEKAARELGDNLSMTTAKERNNFLAKNFGDDPPYWDGTKVFSVTLKEETSFVRFYGGGTPPSRLEGIWILKESDIIGLTIEEVVDKYALPSTPVSMGYVYVPAGEKIQVSCAGGIYGHNGGGVQYRIEKYPPPDEWFYGERK